MKIAFITAIYGNYELTCKKHEKQLLHDLIKCDFICFTDNKYIEANGWTINTNPYHITHNPSVDVNYRNDLINNQHSFNIAKYYKTRFHYIPILKDYDAVIWLDGTIEINDITTSYKIYHKLFYEDNDIFCIRHEMRNDQLINEVIASSNFYRYNSTFWNDQKQPVQPVIEQYLEYVKDGYEDEKGNVMLTCLVGFKMNNKTKEFLDLWNLQIQKFTTQDQISFPYCLYKTGIKYFKCPNDDYWGTNPHIKHLFYLKHEHQK